MIGRVEIHLKGKERAKSRGKADSKSRRSAHREACPCEGSSLEKFVQPAVLAVLAEGDAHGYALTKRIEEMLAATDGSGPHSSGVYKALQTLEKKGIVASSWEKAGNGREKHIYSLTAAGVDCLATWACTLRSYHVSLTRVLRAVCTSTMKKTGSCCVSKPDSNRRRSAESSSRTKRRNV